MIQSIILLIVSAFHLGKRKGIIRLVRTLFVVTVVGSIAYSILNNYYTEYLISFINKIGSDTRSLQYREMFTQTPFYQFVFGGGINASYYLEAYGEYSYIDNQYIFILFRYGIFMLFPYVFFFVSPAWSLWKAEVDFHKKIGIFIIIMWLLALAGISVYNGILVDIKNIVMPMVAGRIAFLSYENRQKIQLPNDNP